MSFFGFGFAIVPTAARCKINFVQAIYENTWLTTNHIDSRFPFFSTRTVTQAKSILSHGTARL